jgi:hypothetical protein
MSSNIDDGEFIDVDDILINRINTMTKDDIILAFKDFIEVNGDLRSESIFFQKKCMDIECTSNREIKRLQSLAIKFDKMASSSKIKGLYSENLKLKSKIKRRDDAIKRFKNRLLEEG